MKSENKRDFYQSHECEGYRAKILIEWSTPDNILLEILPPWRMREAEEIADSIMGFAGPKIRDIVQRMRGKTD
jgi:hypothetical protein